MKFWNVFYYVDQKTNKKLKRKENENLFFIYTVCNGEQSIVGIEFDDRSEVHIGDDDVENVGDIGDDVACGIGNMGDIL